MNEIRLMLFFSTIPIVLGIVLNRPVLWWLLLLPFVAYGVGYIVSASLLFLSKLLD